MITTTKMTALLAGLLLFFASSSYAAMTCTVTGGTASWAFTGLSTPTAAYGFFWGIHADRVAANAFRQVTPLVPAIPSAHPIRPFGPGAPWTFSCRFPGTKGGVWTVQFQSENLSTVLTPPGYTVTFTP